MARVERVFTVLIASPSDLDSERDRLEEIIRELNVAWSKNLGLRLEPVRWETHGYPGIGEDPQDVLNRQLGEEHDIFLGMMWSRFGTPTGRADSGTEEEFGRALARYRRNPSSVKIMFYFKDAPLPLSKVNPEELSKIMKFKSSLGDEGTLHWSFSSLEDFERLVRLHLTRQVQEFAKSLQQTQEPALTPEPRATTGTAVEMSTAAEVIFEPTVTHEELGLLDLLEIMEEHSSAVNETVGRITSEVNNLGVRLEKHNEEMNKAAALIRSGGKFSPRAAKALISKSALEMDHFVARVRPELPLLRDGLRDGIDAMVKASLLSIEIGEANREQLSATRGSLVELEGTLHSSSESTRMFRDSVQGLPRMTSTLNRAKREASALLDEIIGSLEAGRRLLTEAIKGLDQLQEPGKDA